MKKYSRVRVVTQSEKQDKVLWKLGLVRPGGCCLRLATDNMDQSSAKRKKCILSVVGLIMKISKPEVSRGGVSP